MNLVHHPLNYPLKAPDGVSHQRAMQGVFLSTCSCPFLLDPFPAPLCLCQTLAPCLAALFTSGLATSCKVSEAHRQCTEQDVFRSCLQYATLFCACVHKTRLIFCCSNAFMHIQTPFCTLKRKDTVPLHLVLHIFLWGAQTHSPTHASFFTRCNLQNQSHGPAIFFKLLTAARRQDPCLSLQEPECMGPYGRPPTYSKHSM